MQERYRLVIAQLYTPKSEKLRVINPDQLRVDDNGEVIFGPSCEDQAPEPEKVVEVSAHQKRSKRRNGFPDHLRGNAGESNISLGNSHKAVSIIRQLYAVEKTAAQNDLSPNEILELRQSKSLPIVNEFFALMGFLADQVPPQSLLGKAVRYALNLKKQLCLFFG